MTSCNSHKCSNVLNKTTTKLLLARHVTCHMKGLITLRKHDTQQLFLICVKNSISNVHVIGMPLNEQTISMSLFFLTTQFYQSQAYDPPVCLTTICTFFCK